MEIRQLFDAQSSTYTYLVWDAVSREAALIDPVKDQIGRDIQLLHVLGLSLRYTLETHIHTDHITGAGHLRSSLDSLVLVHENTHAKCADILLKDGDQIPVGTGRITALYTPGHTNHDITYSIDSAIFTGDTLLIQDCGWTDGPGGDAGTLYDSVTKRLFSLPDDTVIYPGHDYHGHSYSTIGEEKRNNPHFRAGTTRQSFISLTHLIDPVPPERAHETIPCNIRCGY